MCLSTCFRLCRPLEPLQAKNARVGQGKAPDRLTVSSSQQSLLFRLVYDGPDSNDCEVANTIQVRATSRIFTHDPVRGAAGAGIRAEHYEVVISLVTSGLRTPRLVKVRQLGFK